MTVIDELRACVGLPALGMCENMQWGETEKSVAANGVERLGVRCLYAVAGGPHPGIHVTNNYDATVRSSAQRR